jgi:hypothetical protein
VTAARERWATAAQYVLLGGFAAVASGISSQGLTGFARSNMALTGPWPYLLFFSLDGAAGVCAVLLARRAARGEGSAPPRLAVWGLVAASAAFNWAHAPRRPGGPEAYALMPVVAAVLFEFCLQETRARQARRPGRRLGALRWLRPRELVRVHLLLSASGALTADEATRQVRAEAAARALYRLRTLARPGGRRARRALRRAHAALTAAGFADPAVAADVLGRVQVLTMTQAIAMLDYASADAARAAIHGMITSAPTPGPGDTPRPAGEPATGPHAGAAQGDCRARAEEDQGDPAPAVPPPLQAKVSAPAGPCPPGLDQALVHAARGIVAGAAASGTRLTQVALAERLRGEGWTIANDRLSLLAATVELGPRRA